MGPAHGLPLQVEFRRASGQAESSRVCRSRVAQVKVRRRRGYLATRQNTIRRRLLRGSRK
jgi:hypothetical protein